MATFDPIFARDPGNPDMIASNATITIFDPADPDKTPLALTKANGTPLSNPITVNRQGMADAFAHPTLYRVGWEGGGFSGFFTAIEKMHEDTLAARTAAENSVLLAQDAQEAAQAAGATAGTEAAAAAAVETAAALADAQAAIDASAQAAADAAALVDAPAGTVVRSTVEGDLDNPGSGIATRLTATTVSVVESEATKPGGILPSTFATKRGLRVGSRKRLNAQPVKHMVHAAAAGHGWALQSDVSNNASSDLNDTSDFLIGSQAMRITTAGTGAYVGWDKTLAAPIDASDCDFRFWFKFEDPDRRLANIQIILGDATLTWRSTITAFSFSTATNYQQYALQAGRWNILDVPQAAGWTATGTPNWAGMQRILIKASDTAGKPITVRLGGAAFTQRNHNGRFPNGVATLTFDDSYESAYTYARVKMDQYGHKGTLFPIIDRVDMVGKLALAQIRAAYQNGWDVAGHAYTNANHAIGMPGMTQAERLAELENIKAWMDENNFQTQAYAYPLGTHDAASEVDVAAYFDCGRLAFLQRDVPQAPAQPYAIQAVNAGTQKANLNTHIQRAVAGKGWVNFIFHDIKASGATGNDINQADFDQLLVDLAASGIAVRTMSEVLATIT